MTPAIALGIAAAVLAALALAFWLGARRRHQRAEAELADARQLFHRRREWLEAKFLTLASQSGKPRGLAWDDCEFDNGVAMARDRRSGQLRAFVAVTISFSAVEGGGMEDVEAVDDLRAATAVFAMNESGEWTTEGRAIFNLSPHQAIEHFQKEVIPIEAV